jgi:hypothetical protein
MVHVLLLASPPVFHSAPTDKDNVGSETTYRKPFNSSTSVFAPMGAGVPYDREGHGQEGPG